MEFFGQIVSALGDLSSWRGVVTIAVEIALLVVLVLGALSGVVQAAWRFGLALYKKKILVVADGDDYRMICDDLVESGLIREKNVEQVTDGHLSKIDEAYMVIISYGYLNSEGFKDAVWRKGRRCGLVVYCPPGRNRLGSEEMSLLNSATFTTLCNFRGRLVNDVLLMMLSVSFKKKDLKKC